MRTRTAWLLPLLSLAPLLAGCAGSAPAQAGRPEPRAYRYTCDLFTYDVNGQLKGKMRIAATQTRGLPGGIVRWSDAVVSHGTSLEGAFGPETRQDYMEGLSYPTPDPADALALLSPEIYRSFPATIPAFLMKSAVVDAHGFDQFSEAAARLKPGETAPCAGSGSKDIPLFGDDGRQDLRRLEMTLIGSARRNGKDCDVLSFQADIAPVAITMPGARLSGSTLFWGEVWVSRGDRQIEHASMREHALMAAPAPEARLSSLHSTYRVITLESLPPPR